MNPTNINQLRKMYLSTVLAFGKHTGKTVFDIIKVDVAYVNWLIDKVDDCYIDDKVKRMFSEFWERENEKKFGKRNDVNYTKK